MAANINLCFYKETGMMNDNSIKVEMCSRKWNKSRWKSCVSLIWNANHIWCLTIENSYTNNHPNEPFCFNFAPHCRLDCMWFFSLFSYLDLCVRNQETSIYHFAFAHNLIDIINMLIYDTECANLCACQRHQ